MKHFAEVKVAARRTYVFDAVLFRRVVYLHQQYQHTWLQLDTQFFLPRRTGASLPFSFMQEITSSSNRPRPSLPSPFLLSSAPSPFLSLSPLSPFPFLVVPSGELRGKGRCGVFAGKTV